MTALKATRSWTGLACSGAAAMLAFATGRRRHVRTGAELQQRLLAGASRPGPDLVRLAECAQLPAPVARYFRRVLTDRQSMVRVARMRQHGALRTGVDSRRWMPFDATQVIVPPAHGFFWDAHIALAGPLHLSVRDAYIDGCGIGRVAAQSAVSLAQQSGSIEINSGSLQRYLAEGPWYPTALLPAAGVRWTAIDEQRATATLTDGGLSVAMEFRFNADDEIASVYTPGRWRKLGRGFVLTPWEGRFHGYQRIAGMQVPTAGEVGWVVDNQWQAVWKGEVRDIAFELFPASAVLQPLNGTKGST